MIRCRRWFPWRARSRVGVAEGVWLRCGAVSSVDWLRTSPIGTSGGITHFVGRCVCVIVRFVWGGAFVGCCFACDCVLGRVRFARVLHAVFGFFCNRRARARKGEHSSRHSASACVLAAGRSLMPSLALRARPPREPRLTYSSALA